MSRVTSPQGLSLWLATYKMRIVMALAQRASLGEKNWLDRRVTALLAKMLGPKSPSQDFMRDDLVDADIGFTVEELAQFQSSRTSPPLKSADNETQHTRRP